MTEKLEKLITYAIADGVITDKEREILVKNANEEGIDIDEFEMILEGRLFEKQQELKIINSPQTTSVSQNKSNKEGDLKKCPSCGAPAQSFKTNCTECGHEYRNVQAERTITDLFLALEKIQNSKTESMIMVNWEALVSTITTFPIPNSKEAILEFLAQAYPKAAPVGWWQRANDGYLNNVRNAWKTKCMEIIIKARFSMKDDKRTLEEIEAYGKQLGIK